LIKRERSIDEIRQHYRVSHTTAYKIRNAFLDGGRRALGAGVEKRRTDLEARVRALEERIAGDRSPGRGGKRSGTAGYGKGGAVPV